MIFDKAAAIEKVGLSLTTTERSQVGRIEHSMGLALDDLSLRMEANAFITSYTESLAADTRQVKLTGKKNDLRNIFALKITSDDKEPVLEYRPPNIFLRDYDDPDAEAGDPTYFTQITTDQSFPVVKFNVPLAGSETLTVYYYIEMTPDNLVVARSISVIVAGTLAYFLKIDSTKGRVYYAQFKELTAMLKGKDTFVTDYPDEFRLSKEDRQIRSTINSVRKHRS